MEKTTLNNTPKPHRFLGLIKTTIEILLIVVFIFFEELVWKRFAIPVKNYISKLSFLEKVEISIMQQDKYTILFIFLLALGLAEIMGLYSGFLFISGAIFLSVLLYLVKIIVAGFTFWIFSFAKPKLLEIDWFKIVYELFMKFISFMTRHELYLSVKEKINKFKDYIKSMRGKSKFKAKYEGLKELFRDNPEEEIIEESTTKKDSKDKKSNKKASSKDKDSNIEKTKNKKGDI